MAQVRWSPQAIEDLESIAEFISRDSAYYARLFVIDVLGVADRLELFPESGRVVPELKNPAIREVLLGNYRIVFRRTRSLCEILTVYHGARLLNPSTLKGL
jgi:plasmid stabilization system protein ParE